MRLPFRLLGIVFAAVFVVVMTPFRPWLKSPDPDIYP